MVRQYKTFKEFYPFYLSQHSNKTCRLLHVIGTTILLAITLTAVYHKQPILLIFVPIAGYGFAWVGHFFFEKNKPATFTYPLWSLVSDFKMYFQVLSGTISLDTSKDANIL
ncbi:MAG: DUF962 domain-containing protein [Flavobacteriaceae bacterium]